MNINQSSPLAQAPDDNVFFVPQHPAPEPCALRQAVPMPLKKSDAVFHSFNGLADGKEHFAVGFGRWREQETTLVRLHSECMTGDLFGSERCDCGEQLEEAIERMSGEGGVLLYLRQEGRGIGLYNKIDAYALQDQGFDTYEANRMLHLPEDGRSYHAAAQMLHALGIRRVRLLSNNPDKIAQLFAHGVNVVDVSGTNVYLKSRNERYLRTKVEKAGHSLRLDKEIFRHDPA